MDLNEKTYESFCLLYIDNELSLSERTALEKYAQENEHCKIFLTELTATKLAAPSFIFEDKESLYRFDAMEATLPKKFKESLYKKSTPVVKMNFGYRPLRLLSAVAALLALFIGYQYIPNAKNSEATLAISESKNKFTQNAALDQHLDSSKESNRLAQETSKATIKKQGSIIAGNNRNYHLINKKSYSGDQIAMNNINISSHGKLDEIVHSKQVTETNNATESLLAQPNQEATLAKKTVLASTINESSTLSTNNNSVSATAESFTDIDTEDQEKTIYIANLEINGDKLRGFTRRVNAIFRRNKTDKDK
jgi:hypothetical protein